MWNGRFPGPITFGWDGERENRLPRLWSAIPVSAATMPAPKVLKSDWISETTFPCWSAAVRYTVSPAATCHGPGPRGLLAPSPASDDRLAGARPRLGQVDLLPALGSVVLGDQPPKQILWHRTGIGKICVPVRIGDLLGFDEQVQVCGRIVAQPRDVVGLEDVQHLERREPCVFGGSS